ncbi:MAG: hypothetical protein JWO91_2828 [Acidobacteriaceae bacterium]|jgi:hypothetical protein|nr:hypothetical protein [Acidobacteriaceae bacterium]
MTNFPSKIIARLAAIASIFAGTLSVPFSVEAADLSVSAEDHALIQAISKGDKVATGAFLDENFSWTNRTGETWNRTQLLEKMADLTLVYDGKAHDYGSVVYITGTAQSSSDRIRFVRVWVKEQPGWKVLLQQDTVVVGKTATTQATVPVGTSCENPCKSIPYDATSAEAQVVVASWEALEDAVNHRDANGWASHVADEFVFNVKEDGNPLTKADRVAIIKKQAQGKTVTDIGTVIPGTMNVWIFGDTAVMSDQQQPTRGGNPYQAMRIWVKRDGRWQLVYSQQTVIDRSTRVSQ